MAPATNSKAKAKGVSASSFLDLKAELFKKEEEFAKNKAAGKSTYVVGGIKRPDKKPTVWAKQNKGLLLRAARDVELEEISKPTLESARATLERKAKIYEKLRKGKTGGLNDKQYDALLVDFDTKSGYDQFESDSDDVDESVQLARPPDEDDPFVEYEDEFGRIRTARRSEVPRAFVPPEDEQDEDEDIIIRNPTNHFPIYEPSAERVAEIAAAHAEDNNPLNVHYDASRENRAKGAGFYQFSADEETRKKQMADLRTAREETGKAREDAEAVDVRPGEIEGMQDTTGTIRSRAMEKRKRELEERRKLVEAKRRKVVETDKADDASRSTQKNGMVEATPQAAASIPLNDPLAVLEAKVKGTRENTKAGVPNTPAADADSFLARLEHELLGSKRH